METRAYRRQILGVTGEITTDVLDVGIAANLAREWGSCHRLSWSAEQGPKWTFPAVDFCGDYLRISAGRKTRAKNGPTRIKIPHACPRFQSAERHDHQFAARNLVITFRRPHCTIADRHIAGATLLAGLGIAGFIIGFALQDSLSNFASGMMILAVSAI